MCETLLRKTWSRDSSVSWQLCCWASKWEGDPPKLGLFLLMEPSSMPQALRKPLHWTCRTFPFVWRTFLTPCSYGFPGGWSWVGSREVCAKSPGNLQVWRNVLNKICPPLFEAGVRADHGCRESGAWRFSGSVLAGKLSVPGSWLGGEATCQEHQSRHL